jgi:DNA-binding NtrC family response regulator
MRPFMERFTDADLHCFYSPHAALATFAAAPEAFDFILTDLEMPGMSGLDLGSRVRKLAPAIKILLSTESGILTEVEAMQRGFCGLLPKPFPLGTLRQALDKAGLLTIPGNNYSEPYAALTPAKGCLV